MPPPNATEEATRPSDTAIPMPPPAYNEVTEATALKDHAGDKKVYTPGTHYYKSQIFVQKFNFDKNPILSRVFHPIFF